VFIVCFSVKMPSFSVAVGTSEEVDMEEGVEWHSAARKDTLLRNLRGGIKVCERMCASPRVCAHMCTRTAQCSVHVCVRSLRFTNQQAHALLNVPPPSLRCLLLNKEIHEHVLLLNTAIH
jgi:hypothetical protein